VSEERATRGKGRGKRGSSLLLTEVQERRKEKKKMPRSGSRNGEKGNILCFLPLRKGRKKDVYRAKRSKGN